MCQCHVDSFVYLVLEIIMKKSTKHYKPEIIDLKSDLKDRMLIMEFCYLNRARKTLIDNGCIIYIYIYIYVTNTMNAQLIYKRNY